MLKTRFASHGFALEGWSINQKQSLYLLPFLETEPPSLDFSPAIRERIENKKVHTLIINVLFSI